MATDRPDLHPRSGRVPGHGANRSTLGRPLGGIEIIYHHSTSRGVDMICLMTKIQSKLYVSPTNVEKALKSLCNRHPLLRMTIRSRDYPLEHEFCFVENVDTAVDFGVAARSDWLEYVLEEVARPLDIRHGPLWKCRMLTSDSPEQAAFGHTTACDHSSTLHIPGHDIQKHHCVDKDQSYSDGNSHSKIQTDTRKLSAPESICSLNNHSPTTSESSGQPMSHETTFLFVWHHAIMDGGYVLWVFRDFVHLLDNYTQGVPTNTVPCMPLMPPVEHALHFPTHVPPDVGNPVDNQSVCHVSLCHSNPSDRLLLDYNRTFVRDISEPKQIPKNNCSVFKLSERESEFFRRNCEAAGASPTGAIIAASLLGLVELIYGSTHCAPPEFEIPFEVMLDLRRFCPLNVHADSVEFYPGVASIDIPLKAKIRSKNKVLNVAEFWEMARSLGVAVQKNVKSKETYEWIQSAADVNTNSLTPVRRQQHGKSPFVLCVSNMGRCDGVLGEEVERRIRLTDLHGHSSILVDDMPLFFITVFSLNGRFCGNVSYCENYTSSQTAAQYIGNIHKHLLSQSNL